MPRLKYTGPKTGYHGALVVPEMGYQKWSPGEEKDVDEKTYVALVAKYGQVFTKMEAGAPAAQVRASSKASAGSHKMFPEEASNNRQAGEVT
jgi:hypothetical protein